MFLCAKGKWIETDGELIRLTSTFALIFPPKVEIAGWRHVEGQLSKLRPAHSSSTDLTEMKEWFH